jgi:hypothetical protein
MKKGRIFSVLIVSILIISLLSFYLLSNFKEEKTDYKLTVFVYYENLWNSPPTINEASSYNISIHLNDDLVYTTQHNTTYRHPDTEEIGTYIFNESKVKLMANNKDYNVVKSKTIDLNEFRYVVISFAYNDTSIAVMDREPTFQ